MRTRTHNAAAIFALISSAAACRESATPNAEEAARARARFYQAQLAPVWIVAPERFIRPPATFADAGVPSDAGSGGDASTSNRPDGGPASDADAVIRGTLHPGARDCFNAGMRESIGQRGRIVLQVRVGPNGEVVQSGIVYNSGLNAKTAKCIADVGRTLVFQPPGGNGSTINCPMNFVMQATGQSGVAEEAVRGTFLPAATACYARTLFSNPAVEGETTYYIEVGASGRPSGVSADENPKLPHELLSCVAEAFKASSFAPGGRVLVPVRFHPTTDINRPRTFDAP